MAYFGTALAHAVLLGIALGFLLELEPILAVFAMCLMLAGCLLLLERQRLVSLDALLGVLAHAVFAAGLVVIAFMERLRVDLIGYLFGDILSVGAVDLWLIFATAAVATAALAWQWRNLLSVTVNRDLAAVEGVPVERVRLLLLFLLAAVIAVGMKIVGMLLVVALVIIPAAAARRMSTTPEQMAVASTAIGILAVVAGLFSSLEWDLPAGPAIVLVASAVFAASLLIPVRGQAPAAKNEASRRAPAQAPPASHALRTAPHHFQGVGAMLETKDVRELVEWCAPEIGRARFGDHPALLAHQEHRAVPFSRPAACNVGVAAGYAVHESHGLEEGQRAIDLSGRRPASLPVEAREDVVGPGRPVLGEQQARAPGADSR